MPNIHININGKKLTQTEFNKIELFVLKYFESVWSDIKNSINTLRKNDATLLKSEVCLGFIGADALSRFRAIVITGIDERDNKNRFKKWFDEFVFNDSNTIYDKYKGEINCDSATAWDLRNSLLHFYGYPSSRLVSFATLDSVTRIKFENLVSQNNDGKHVSVVNPYRLIEAIQYGLLAQLDSLKEMIKGDDNTKKEIYARGIVHCYKIIQREGAIFVST